MCYGHGSLGIPHLVILIHLVLFYLVFSEILNEKYQMDPYYVLLVIESTLTVKRTFFKCVFMQMSTPAIVPTTFDNVFKMSNRNKLPECHFLAQW